MLNVGCGTQHEEQKKKSALNKYIYIYIGILTKILKM